MPEDPIHFNRQYLEKQMRTLAGGQRTGKVRQAGGVDPILDEAQEVLTAAYRKLAREARNKSELSSSAEWLIDNFYIIQEQIVQLREDLPPSYYNKLPALAEGEFEGYPRVYELVQKLAGLSDNTIGVENTSAAVQAYQERQTLSLGELWAVPILIRLALVERLADRSLQLLELHRVRERADRAVREMEHEDNGEPGYLLRKLGKIADKEEGERFLTFLARQMQFQGMLTDSERDWFDYRFRRWNSTLEDQLRINAQRTSRLHLSIQNAIATLREVAETDWSDFVEDCSLVERTLRLDPSGCYPKMDFSSRDRYRKVVERLSARSEYSETGVAREVLRMAEEGQQSGSAEKRAHVGYYLAGEGYGALTDRLGYRMALREKLRRWGEDHPSGYFSLVGGTAAALLGIVGYVAGLLEAPIWLILVSLGAAFFPALDLGIVSVNRLLTLLLPPRILPKLDLEGPIPDRYRTLVVVPTLFTSPEDVREQFEALEIRALANPNPALQFALLSDFTDHEEAHAPGDRAILEAAREEVRRLNRRYARADCPYGNRFFLLHRRREWNAGEQAWMGWERKRGKLEELNRLLTDPDADTTYQVMEGDFLASIRKTPVRYVLTLDADTKLPPGSAIDLVNTAAHPLNEAEISESGDRVVDGYGIFQPRISIEPKSAGQSWFARIFSGNVGIDPYTVAVSDVYQDLFGEGVFTGKGLYDVSVFHRVLGDRFPENRILSHDLLESTYLRSALLSDIELFDDYPGTYRSYAKRNHRWIRGDWQILSWLFARVPGNEGREKNPINAVSRWKIFDNLRRSLNPIFLLLFLLAGWTLLPGSPWIWTAAVFGIVAFPIYSSFTVEIFGRPVRVKWKLYLEKIRSSLKMNTIQALTTFLFLPHQAWLSLDAVITTMYRLFGTGNKLLEWTSASQVERSEGGSGTGTYYRTMWANPAWALLSFAAGWYFHPLILLLAAPVSLGWALAPALAWQLSVRSPRRDAREPDETERVELRGYARATWHYFERFMGEEHNWLPPDNFQEDPYLGAVERTSPTNMGLALASACAACDFGYLTVPELLDMLESALESMRELERYSGHFYNWYDTREGEALAPRYVSTVDSGNLAASLLYVKQYLSGLSRTAPAEDVPASWPDGLSDTLRVLREICEAPGRASGEPRSEGRDRPIKEALEYLETIQSALPADTGDPGGYRDRLDELLPMARELAGLSLGDHSERISEETEEEIRRWFAQPLRQVEAQMAALDSPSAVGGEENPGDAGHGVRRAEKLAGWCDELVREMDFSLLYDEGHNLFSIGYNTDRAALDESTYDLLASEARLASFIAIAKGEVPPRHWFRLSRRLTSIDRNEILLSWGGTMFEYLMPMLFMERYPDTLMDNTCEHVVSWQKNYGESRGRPWGFSESGYGVLNLELHYQYRTFGAPGLGLKRGLAEHYIVSPYSSMLAMMVRPGDAMANLRRLREMRAYGLYGFYESVDYSSMRENAEEEGRVVRMFMAHHQGMSLLALSNVLGEDRVQKLFHRDPLVRSCELLLQERVPRGVPVKEPRPIEVELEPGEEQASADAVDHVGKEGLADYPPRVHILSNGEHSTMVTHAGTGWSWNGETALTRWRADRVKDAHGFFIYVRDLETGRYWSSGYRPVNREADRYDSWFHAGKVQTARVDEWIETFTEICVSPEDSVEFRKVTLTNYSDRPRRLELTSYAEVVLNRREADEAHPAFSNLFVQTDHLPEHSALLARRRPRSAGESPSWLVHTLAVGDERHTETPLEYETDRKRFIGRGRSLDDPAALDPGSRLSGTVGNVPDPVVSLRKGIELGPGEKVSLTFGLGMAGDEKEAAEMADRYDNSHATDRVFDLASIYGRMELEHIDLTGKRAHYFQKLAGVLLYGSGEFRTGEETLVRNRRSQSALWSYGISGDLPILLYRIRESDHVDTVKRLLKGHALWRMKGFETDLVILNDHPPSYIDELQESLTGAIQSSPENQRLNQRGGIFLLRGDQVPEEDQVLLETVAAAVMSGKLPSLDFRSAASPEKEENGKAGRDRYRMLEPPAAEGGDAERKHLRYYNGFGGFSDDGREYVIYVRPGSEDPGERFPPAPWINVVANPDFGFIASERGSDFTWSVNSRENRLTPWSNDAVIDPAGEALYVRDEEQRRFWSPAPGPTPGASRYEVRHGFGYSRYRCEVFNLKQELTKWVAPEDPVKLVRLRLTNTDLSDRTLSVFHYLEWVLGVHRPQATPFVVTEREPEHRAILARNHYSEEFPGRVAFSAWTTDAEVVGEFFTADRVSFIGRNRGVTNPRALSDLDQLEGKTGAGYDPCAATQLRIRLSSGESADLYFLIGEAANRSDAVKLMERYEDPARIEASLSEVRSGWRDKLGVLQISTPAPDLDLLFNGWLQYQNIACRMWGRSGFYQSGGAYGFRDQLQDAAAALYADAGLAREQILRHAAHQFEEGDVLHWWHPPGGSGIRSRISDDLLWLPHIASFYAKSTGDRQIWEEEIPFLTARALEEDEHEVYMNPERSRETATLFEHCCRAIDRSLETGSHGLPLMGTGDWNDGMNRVGEGGEGESVWLGFFLCHILDDIIPLCESFGEKERAERYRRRRESLGRHLNREGWDGDWYRRAFYDDGTPLGSAENEECRIDAIAQSWSVISGVATPEKGERALDSALEHLVSEEEGIIRLLTPPFDRTDRDPGYIKGYIPGVRENGGQYTHAAIWLVKALAKSGRGGTAVRLMRMLSPVSHSQNRSRAGKYQVEPYAVAADVYGEPPLTGMGGWTWYTGSAGWMYRVILESILGLRIRKGERATLTPSVPDSWGTFSITWKYGKEGTVYHIEVVNSDKDGTESRGTLDGETTERFEGGIAFPIVRDGQEHRVRLFM